MKKYIFITIFYNVGGSRHQEITNFRLSGESQSLESNISDLIGQVGVGRQEGCWMMHDAVFIPDDT